MEASVAQTFVIAMKKIRLMEHAKKYVMSNRYPNMTVHAGIVNRIPNQQ